MKIIDLNDLSKISKTLKPEEIVLIKSGVYNDIKLMIEAKGEKNKNIIIKPEVPGEVILTGNSFIHIKGENTILSNFILQNGGGGKRSIRVDGKYNRLTGFDISFSKDCEKICQIDGYCCRVDHCVFRDHSRKGVYLTVERPDNELNYALIDHNIFKDRSKLKGVTNGLEGIRIGTSHKSLSNSRTIVYNNLFENMNGEIETMSIKSGENIILNNTLKNSEGTITLRHGNKNMIYKNKILGNNLKNSGGIRIIGEKHMIINNLLDNIIGNGTTRTAISINTGKQNTKINEYYQVKDVLIHKNIILNCKTVFAIGTKTKSTATLKPKSTTISNNIVYKGQLFSTYSKCIGSSDMIYKKNKFFTKNVGDSISANAAGKIKLESEESFKSNIDYNEFGIIEEVGYKWSNTDFVDINIKDLYTKFRNDILLSCDLITQESKKIKPKEIEEIKPEKLKSDEKNTMILSQILEILLKKL